MIFDEQSNYLFPPPPPSTPSFLSKYLLTSFLLSPYHLIANPPFLPYPPLPFRFCIFISHSPYLFPIPFPSSRFFPLSSLSPFLSFSFLKSPLFPVYSLSSSSLLSPSTPYISSYFFSLFHLPFFPCSSLSRSYPLLPILSFSPPSLSLLLPIPLLSLTLLPFPPLSPCPRFSPPPLSPLPLVRFPFDP